ncbi:hypothetical protein LBMAG52_45470 [Planctomycetia bacterium]|nr:hypothetical protein LBMAG52_45470 [Planctomycetia bacterium]
MSQNEVSQKPKPREALMVFGPGGYRLTDYLRIGIPLDLLYFAVAVTVIPRMWPF